MKERILVTQSSMPTMEEYVNEIKDIWENHWLTNMGPKHEELRTQLKTYLDVNEVELFTNGHMSIELTLQAMQLTGEVITTPFTFASTTNAIIRNGLEPVFCDVDPITYTMDPSKIEELITEKTSAIMPVHVYGNICDVERIEKIAKKHNLKVIYDAAHTFGEKYNERGIASFGDASCFSFHATKVFNSIEGGCACFNDKDFGKRLFNLKNFGISGEDIAEIGPNAKMNEFCAAMGLCNLKHIDNEIAKRKRAIDRYRERLSGVDGIQLNCIQDGLESNYAYFPVIFDKEVFGMNRDEVMEVLKENNIIARKYFYPLTSEFTCFNGKYDTNETPVALKISENVLTLPLYSELSLENVDRICDIILQ